MSEVVKVCNIHGDLNLEQAYRDGNGYRCKLCRMQSRVKDSYNCKHHGVLPFDLLTKQLDTYYL